MKAVFAVLVLTGLVLAGCGGGNGGTSSSRAASPTTPATTEGAATHTATTATSTTAATTACGDRVFGHITSLVRTGNHYTMRFDPAWFTSGVTANVAAAEDGVVQPGEPVPNDNYVIEEGHRKLTYLVPTDTKVTVLTRTGDPGSNGATPISVDELARIVNGGQHRQLFETLDTGVWLGIRVDTTCSIDQQYRP
jgi:hypothetical protein